MTYCFSSIHLEFGFCGFTEEEVFDALDQQELSDYKEKVKEWYDGFIFGSHAFHKLILLSLQNLKISQDKYLVIFDIFPLPK